MGIGRTTIERAEQMIEAAEQDPEAFGYLVEQMDRSGKVSGGYRRLQVEQQARRIEQEPPALPAGPFRVIVADPPWAYETGNSLPYPTMRLDESKRLAVSSIAADDAVLWLWTTN